MQTKGKAAKDHGKSFKLRELPLFREIVHYEYEGVYEENKIVYKCIKSRTHLNRDNVALNA